MKPLPLLLLAFLGITPLRAADSSIAATAVNALGLDLLGRANSNTLLSPYSIQFALAMTYAGADGITREEMQKVLHYPVDDVSLNDSFHTLDSQLEDMVKTAATAPAQADPVTLNLANRLFGQQGLSFRPSFLALVQRSYSAPMELVNFATSSEAARQHINDWVSTQTCDRIQDLIPSGGVDGDTALVLVNAVYFKAAWTSQFQADNTEPRPFHFTPADSDKVPTMRAKVTCGFAHRDGYTALGLDYANSDLQFLILLPDAVDGLPALEAKLTPALLAGNAQLEPRQLILELPKFKLKPPTMELTTALKALGMKTAFDPGKANFDKMSEAKGLLSISHIFHKTFLDLNENGTEAAAATAVVMTLRALARNPPEPPEFHVDHPFLFAIQDRRSGVCLFLGCLADPR